MTTKQHKYKATWRLANGSLRGDLTGNNHQALAKLVRRVLRGNLPSGQSGTWVVFYDDGTENPSGCIHWGSVRS